MSCYHDITFTRKGASKPTRNGYVHPNTMFHLAVIASTLTCTESHQLVDAMQKYKIEDETRAEMIQIVKDETAHCWDANAD